MPSDCRQTSVARHGGNDKTRPHAETGKATLINAVSSGTTPDGRSAGDCHRRRRGCWRIPERHVRTCSFFAGNLNVCVSGSRATVSRGANEPASIASTMHAASTAPLSEPRPSRTNSPATTVVPRPATVEEESVRTCRPLSPKHVDEDETARRGDDDGPDEPTRSFVEAFFTTTYCFHYGRTNNSTVTRPASSASSVEGRPSREELRGGGA